MKRLLQYTAYLGYRAVVGLLGSLPLKVAFRFGQFVGAGAHVVLPYYRKLVRRNLRIAFGEEMTEPEIRALAWRHFLTLGANLLSSVRVASMTPGEIRKVVDLGNLDALHHGADGRGVVLVISHIGNWEMLAQLAAFRPGVRMATVFQRLNNPFIDRHILETRQRFGVVLYDRAEGFDRAIRHLRDGGLLGVLVDQHAGDKGIWTPLFGRIASTSPLAAMLALRTGAKVLPMAVNTAGVARWRSAIGGEIPSKGKSVESLTADVNRALERQIRRRPDDWFWVHNRWKTPQPAFLLRRYKRGVHLPDGMTADDLKPFRILIRSSNWLGDAVMGLPAVKAIREGRPDARVAILCREKLVEFWERVPEVDEVVGIPDGEGVVATARRIRGRYDVAILFPNSLRSALEVYLAGVPRRVGYRGHWRAGLLNQIIRDKGDSLRREHHVHRYLRMAKTLGAQTDGRAHDVVRFRHPVRDLDAIPKIGICPGAEYGPAKRWMPESFVAAASEVSQRRTCEWVVFGTAREADLAERIASSIQGDVRNLAGRTSLGELIDELSQCRLLLTNDTGTMHLATMLDVPTVAIFGSTEPKLTGPLGDGHHVVRHQVECSPCFLRECPIDFRCMESIDEDEVVEAILRVLAERPEVCV